MTKAAPKQDKQADIDSKAADKDAPKKEEAQAVTLDDAAIAASLVTEDGAEEADKAPAKKGKAKRWYIIHAHSGFEKKVAIHILEKAKQNGLEDAFEEVVVPTEEVIEVRRGKKVQAERKFFPGYVLAKMAMSDATWQLVRNTPKVTGFLGGKGIRPQPISEAEAQAIFKQAEEGVSNKRNAILFETGEQVKIIDGPFESFIGMVEEVEDDRERLKVSVSIFGRATPVELTFDQVHKVT
jgi:transcriptional antiterminator NusG